MLLSCHKTDLWCNQTLKLNLMILFHKLQIFVTISTKNADETLYSIAISIQTKKSLFCYHAPYAQNRYLDMLKKLKSNVHCIRMDNWP